MLTPHPTSYRRVGSSRSCLGLLAFPPPYRAWITVSNDPDGTEIRGWEELHELIWKELALPFADSFFLCNYNEHWKDQVNVQDYPEILRAHPHDTMHTWGDYTQSRTRRFCRDDAVGSLRTLQRLGVTPSVWTDHSNFSGNLMHRTSGGARPFYVDASGHRYENFDYSLNLIRETGVRFIWDGKLVTLVGQDRPVSLNEYYAQSTPRILKRSLRVCAHPVFQAVKRYRTGQNPSDRSELNTQYFKKSFPDGQVFYCFRRYGFWDLADIDGFGRLISAEFLQKLIAVQGTAIIYTHLGKRPAARINDRKHIPAGTVKALEGLAEQFATGNIMVSSTSRLLQYLILRDHALVKRQTIDFQPDGIVFNTLCPKDLAGIDFGVYSDTKAFSVFCNGSDVTCQVRSLGDGIHLISFPSFLAAR